MPLFDMVTAVAVEKGATPAQIALAWLLAQDLWIVPIPGTTRLHRLDEKLAAAEVELTSAERDRLTQAANAIPIQGGRGTGHEQYL